jgi:hypothetical protein
MAFEVKKVKAPTHLRLKLKLKRILLLLQNFSEFHPESSRERDADH